jgi:UDP-glucose 4-epimerase
MLIQSTTFHQRPVGGARFSQASNHKAAEPQSILVTGAAGYIGSHFTDAFLRQNQTAQVVAVDDLSQGDTKAISRLQKNFPGRVKFFNISVGDRRLASIMQTFKVKAVVHYAGKISVGESEMDPSKYWDGNTAETIRLIRSMDKANVRKMVFSSTAAVYGQPDTVPIREDLPKKPINTYGRSKAMVEDVLSDMNAHRGADGKPLLSFIGLRYFNVAGAHPEAQLGENHPDEAERPHLIPGVIQKIVKGEPVRLFGNDYPTKDGTCVRDYVDVNDLADAHVKALNYLDTRADSPKGVGEFINVGSGNGFTNREVIESLAEVVRKHMPKQPIKLNEEPRRPGDPATLIASNDKAQNLLGWQPLKTLKDMVQSAWQWESKGRQYGDLPEATKEPRT